MVNWYDQLLRRLPFVAGEEVGPDAARERGEDDDREGREQHLQHAREDVGLLERLAGDGGERSGVEGVAVPFGLKTMLVSLGVTVTLGGTTMLRSPLLQIPLP